MILEESLRNALIPMAPVTKSNPEELILCSLWLLQTIKGENPCRRLNKLIPKKSFKVGGLHYIS